jgi:nucleoside-diphosphate-sugar epimerase
MKNFWDVHTLTGKAKTAFLDQGSKIILVGGSGWIGLSTLDLLHRFLPDFSSRVFCFGSSKKTLCLANGVQIKQDPIEDIEFLPKDNSYILLNFSFLTNERLSTENKTEYISTNRLISETLFLQALKKKIKKVVTISSGAVYDNQGDIFDNLDENTYGALKYEEELKFSKLADEGALVVIPRVFNISGPYVSKIHLYMFSSLIDQALRGDTLKINSSNKVIRSFISISELMSVIFSLFSSPPVSEIKIFDTAGKENFEISDLAKKIIDRINPKAKIDRPLVDLNFPEDVYVGKRNDYLSLVELTDVDEVSIDDQILCVSSYLKSIK